MQSLQARIDSFKKAKRVKRYPKKSSSSTASVKWPHPPDFKANADTLAEAGFFFDPSWNERDSVACFMCGKELSDWDESDDPFEIHYTKCQSSCAWAVVRCGLTEDLDDKGRFVFHNKSRLPTSKSMEKARLKTFWEEWWPHDGEPGHGATSIKMAQAGFVYTPQSVGDDTVTCLYCNLSLSGWEKQDDPVHEHRTRDSKAGNVCPFLVFTSKNSTISSKSRRKTKATRGKSVKTSAPMLQRSPSPSQPVSAEQEVAPVPVDVDAPDLPTASEHPLNGSVHSLPDGPSSQPSPGTPSKLNTSSGSALNHPDSIMSLSPHRQPAIVDSESLIHYDRAMSLEQWIRQEISVGYERLLADGQRQIELFRTKAAEFRKCIEEL